MLEGRGFWEEHRYKIVVIVVLPLIMWSIFGSVLTTPSRVINKTMETENIIHSYEWFYDVNASYNAKLGQIKQFKSFYSGEDDKSEKSRLRIEMAAVQQTCRSLSERYNANSEKMNKSIFKGWTLPEQLNQSTCE